MGGVASFVIYPISKPSVLTGTKLVQIWCTDYGELSNSSWFYLITGLVFWHVHRSSQLLYVDVILLSAYKKFRKERFCTKTIRLSGTIHRTNLKTIASIHKSSDLNNVPQRYIKAPRCPVATSAWYCWGLRSEESPCKNYSSLMYVQVHLCLMKKASTQLRVTLSKS